MHDLDDIQALLFGHPPRPVSRHLLYSFTDPAGARALLAQLLDDVVTLGRGKRPLEEPLVSVGLTHWGLSAAGVPDAVIQSLDPHFIDGIAPRRLGDDPSTDSDISLWWNKRFTTDEVHLVVQVHALDMAQLDEVTRELGTRAAAGGVRELLPRADGTRLDGAFSLGKQMLHFGYRDGISGPRIAWDHDPGEGEVDPRKFILGDPTDSCPSMPPRDTPAADFVRGSSYGVFRWIYQDVATFDRFLREEGPRLFPDRGETLAAELLAAKLLGRWRDGTPLVLSPDGPDPSAVTREFSFDAQDADGARCPFSAHIRVMNPRDQPIKRAHGKTPVVLRRGMPYGPPLQGPEDDDVDRGLLGVFLCADVSGQVLTLTGWANKNDFSPVYSSSPRVQDALIGNRVTTDRSFTIPGAAATIEELPQFLRTKGTAILLYPSGRTLGAIARPRV